MEGNPSISSALEDYLETILELFEKEGTVRVTDVAEKLRIAKPTVSQTINKLKSQGFIKQESYGPILLTSTGTRYALKVRSRHSLIRQFLIEGLGVDNETAEKDACLMEHIVSPVTIERIREFLAKKNEPSA